MVTVFKEQGVCQPFSSEGSRHGKDNKSEVDTRVILERILFLNNSAHNE